jgi:hypothetical protein
MRGLPYNGNPSDDIQTQVKLFISLQEFDGKYQKDLELHLQRGRFVDGYVEVEVHEDTKNIIRVTFIPTSKSGKTKPALTEAREILAKAINDWYLANVK